MVRDDEYRKVKHAYLKYARGRQLDNMARQTRSDLSERLPRHHTGTVDNLCLAARLCLVVLADVIIVQKCWI